MAVKIKFNRPLRKRESRYISRCPGYVKSLYEHEAIETSWYKLKLFEYWRSSDVVSNWAEKVKGKITYLLQTGFSGKTIIKLEVENQVYTELPLEIDYVLSGNTSITFYESLKSGNPFGSLLILCNPSRWYTSKALSNILNHELMHAFQTYMIRRASEKNLEKGKYTRYTLELDTDTYRKFLKFVSENRSNDVVLALWNVYHATLKSELAASIQELDSELTQDPNLILDDTKVFQDFISYPLKDLNFLRGFFLVDRDYPDYDHAQYYITKDDRLRDKAFEALSFFKITSDDYSKFFDTLESKIIDNEKGFREQFVMKRFLTS